jgi:hypothetical protein
LSLSRTAPSRALSGLTLSVLLGVVKICALLRPDVAATDQLRSIRTGAGSDFPRPD